MFPLSIKKLQLKNFRNLEEQIIEFDTGINCIFGENGNGKTNILEALYYLVKRKSFRKNTSYPQMLGIDGDNTEILFQSLFYDRESGDDLSYSGKLNEHGGSWFLNGKSTNRKLNLGIVFLNPFDSQGFHNSSSQRRSWVDDHIGQLSKEYKETLSRYNKSLRFRNKLLSKKPNDFRKQIQAIDEEMHAASVYLTAERQNFLKDLSPFVAQAFNELFSEDHDLEMLLDTKLTSDKKEFYLELCQKNREKDEVLGYTHYGIHKDDYVLLFDGLNSFDYCSLGQQKMSYLSLLFAYIELFRYKFNSFPIVLIDDVSGELDKLRWRRLVEYLKDKNFQVLITTANDNFREALDSIESANKMNVCSGIVQKI
ncbi:MAG: DNA replication and repair protein RecF [Halobacteriovoraceae bacterium]|nr:DNA replication and repair protein RecF [Halobacteriovoraceae bacterium]